MAETLAEALQNLSDEKDSMVAALVAKGVDIDDNAGFSDISTALSNIATPVKLTHLRDLRYLVSPKHSTSPIHQHTHIGTTLQMVHPHQDIAQHHLTHIQ